MRFTIGYLKLAFQPFSVGLFCFKNFLRLTTFVLSFFLLTGLGFGCSYMSRKYIVTSHANT
jgi:hypothetical protein